MDKYLTILEVSQKQAYIFESNKVADNIVNSAVIAKCLSPEYIKKVLEDGYNEENNLVYSGGGHTILEFDNADKSKDAVFEITKTVYKDFDGLEVFAKTIKYDDGLSAEDNLKKLTAELEKKKSLRRIGFHHGTFGIEKLDVNTHKPVRDQESAAKKAVKDEEYSESTRLFVPEGYNPAYKFEDLGTERDQYSFIAIVHIDGNGMGKRVDELYDCIDKTDWNTVKKSLKKFSDSIDADFKDAYKEMTLEISNSIKEGSLKGKLNLGKSEGKPYFPIRRIITAGDDICFVTEGRIGIECARVFIEKLSKKKNAVDNKGYSACAGVAIVHQKYPFYRAYELSEQLCSNAKKAGARLSESDNGRNVCSIDWHIEYGEVKDTIEEIKRDYIAEDGTKLTSKPYVVLADPRVYDRIDDKNKYLTFKKNINSIMKSEKDVGSGKIKQLRSVMKKGMRETSNYIDFYKLKGKIDCEYSFDAIEMMDSFLEV